MIDQRVNVLRDAVLRSLREPEHWPKWRDGWQDRADLALLDAVYSTRQKYENTVLPKVQEWQANYPKPAIPELHFLSQIEESEIRKVFGETVLPGVRGAAGQRGKKKSVGIIETAKRLCANEPQFASAADIVREVTRTTSRRHKNGLRETVSVRDGKFLCANSRVDPRGRSTPRRHAQRDQFSRNWCTP